MINMMDMIFDELRGGLAFGECVRVGWVRRFRAPPEGGWRVAGGKTPPVSMPIGFAAWRVRGKLDGWDVAFGECVRVGTGVSREAAKPRRGIKGTGRRSVLDMIYMI